MARSGLTLLELLIALALMAALVGTVLPMVANRAEPMQFEETLRHVKSAVEWCRADARRGGEPVELVAMVDASGRTLLVGVIFGGEEGASRAGVAASSAGTEAERVEAPRRTYLELPAGYRLTRGELDRAVEELAGSEDAFLPPPVDEVIEEEDRRVTVAIFLPDGGAIVGEPVRLEGRRGMRAMLRVNPWTGSATIEPLRDAEEEREEPEQEEEADELLPGAPERDGGGQGRERGTSSDRTRP